MNLKIKKSTVAWVLVAALIALFAIKIERHSASGTWRYRMTVTVSTPEGDKTGSSVREVTASTGGIALPESHASVSLRGEAVVVDLGKRGQLFALLTGYKLGPENGNRLPGYIFKPDGGQFSPQGIRIMSKLRTGPENLTEEWYPRLVHFRDILDQTTAEDVMTMELCNGYHLCMKSNNVEKIFGKGVYIKSITIEMTGDEVTTGIEKWLPWLPDRKHMTGYFGNSKPPYMDPTNMYLNGEEFSKGFYW